MIWNGHWEEVRVPSRREGVCQCMERQGGWRGKSPPSAHTPSHIPPWISFSPGPPPLILLLLGSLGASLFALTRRCFMSDVACPLLRATPLCLDLLQPNPTQSTLSCPASHPPTAPLVSEETNILSASSAFEDVIIFAGAPVAVIHGIGRFAPSPVHSQIFDLELSIAFSNHHQTTSTHPAGPFPGNSGSQAGAAEAP